MRYIYIIILIISIISLNLLAAPTLANPQHQFTLNSIKWIRLPNNPNGVAQLELVVSYYGDEVLLDVKAKLSLACDVDIIPSSSTDIGSWDPGTYKVLTFLINVSQMPSECNGKLFINYGAVARKIPFGYYIVTTQGGSSLEFTLKYAGNPALSVYISPSTIISDAINTLTITIKNTGTGNALDFSAILSFSGAALLNIEQPVIVKTDKLSPGEYREVKISLIPSSPQVTITITSNYVDIYGNNRNEQFTLAVPVASSASVIVVAKPSKLKAGASNKVALEITNYGDAPLKDAMIQLITMGGSQLVVEPLFIEIGDIKPKESASVTITISVPSMLSGTQTLTYTLTYKSEQGAKVSIRDSFNIFVVEQAQLAITAVEVVPQKPEVDDTIIVSLTLLNLGAQTLSKVNVTAESTPGLVPVRRSFYFLGQVQPQSPTSIPFSFKAKEAGKQKIQFRILFEDIYGVKWEVTKTIELNVQEKQLEVKENEKNRGFNTLIAIIFAFLTVIGLFIAYKYYRKRGTSKSVSQ